MTNGIGRIASRMPRRVGFPLIVIAAFVLGRLVINDQVFFRVIAEDQAEMLGGFGSGVVIHTEDGGYPFFQVCQLLLSFFKEIICFVQPGFFRFLFKCKKKLSFAHSVSAVYFKLFKPPACRGRHINVIRFHIALKDVFRVCSAG